MKYHPEIHQRKSIRLKEYDYSQNGAYFITVCTQNKDHLFGNIIDGEMQLNDAGKIAEQCWREIPQHYPNVILDEYVVMPNHVHGILIIDKLPVGANDYSPKINHLPKNSWANDYSPLQYGTSKTIGAIIRGYKIGVTKWYRTNTNVCSVWQRNYYEHVIRNKESLEQIREYITNNPINWQQDELNTVGANDHSPLQKFSPQFLRQGV